MKDELKALTMQRRLAAKRLAQIAGNVPVPTAATAKPKNMNGKVVAQAKPVLITLKTQ